MNKNIWKICSFNFTLWNAATLDLEAAKLQIDKMLEECAINTVTFAFAALQDHAYSTDIDWKGPHIPGSAPLNELINYAKSKNLRTIVKPMLNTRDKYWRAYIRFFDEDVPCEPKWSTWFKNYTEYIIYYAEICQKFDADMLITGCELVGTDHRSNEWRNLIKEVRSVYSGLLTYNCDKYQEHNVTWWDALDAISSSGYYPINDWNNQLQRIKAVADKFNKPFFFSETGCPSARLAANVPNDWTYIDNNPLDLSEQNRFFEEMFSQCEKQAWHYGYCIWDWPMNFEPGYSPSEDTNYYVLGKPSQNTIKKFYMLNRNSSF
jgi:hypothetical protein